MSRSEEEKDALRKSPGGREFLKKFSVKVQSLEDFLADEETRLIDERQLFGTRQLGKND